jgi:CspA family cold shock protein
MPKGTIRRLMVDRGYGFIKTEGRGDIFFHGSELQRVDYSSLREGQQVEFEVGKGHDGRPQAVKVRLAQRKAE